MDSSAVYVIICNMYHVHLQYSTIYCSAETWSCLWIDEILTRLGYVRDGKLHVYWCYPGKDITDGLVPVECDADCVEMIKASSTVKTLALFVDHTNFLRNIRDDVILNGVPNLPLVISPRNCQEYLIQQLVHLLVQMCCLQIRGNHHNLFQRKCI
jgi:hypothetical protein